MTTAESTQILPPLRQSSAETLGCEQSYALIHIAGLKPPSTPPALRGTQVHEIWAEYATHCAAKRPRNCTTGRCRPAGDRMADAGP